MNCGIYEIINTINNKRYIGKSKDIDNRWKQHINLLSKNKHHSIKLQRAWNKYGNDSFEFNILEITNQDKLPALEKSYIEKLDSFKNGYNMVLENSEYKTKRKVYEFQEQHQEELEKFLNMFIPIIEIIDNPIESLSYGSLNFKLSKAKTYARTYKICGLILKVYEDLSEIKGIDYHLSYINFLNNTFNYKLYKREKKHRNIRKNINFMIFELLYQIYINKELRYTLCCIPNIEEVLLKLGNNIFIDDMLKFLKKNIRQ